MIDHSRAPIYEALLRQRASGASSFHVPGHKSGAGADPEAADDFRAVMSLDYTEIPGLDDLHQPTGAIREAELLAADAYGADHSFLLVGGSTSGNLALLLAVARPGDLVIVQRNAHKSIIHGLMLAGARAVFVAPQTDPETGLATGLSPADAAEALRLYPQAAGLVLTNPNYYGMGVELAPIISAAHAAGVPVIVDEAHGAHFGFHPALPASALAAGADAVVQSTHKTLTAMTMGALLHVRGDRIDPRAVRQRLAMIESSSPSYPIMASIDVSRRQIALHGAEWIGQSLELLERFRRRMAADMPWFRLAGAAGMRGADGAAPPRDPFKLTVSDRTGTLDGFALQAKLAEHGCIAELADPSSVLLIAGIPVRADELDRLFSAFLHISGCCGLAKQELGVGIKNIYSIKFETISPPVAFDVGQCGRPAERVALREAVGREAAEAIVPYPPGIPLLLPGETATAAIVGHLEAWLRAGGRAHGLTDDGRLPVLSFTHKKE